MTNYQKEEVVKGHVTGIEKYGIFVNIEDKYSGLIHISEISYGYVKDVKDFVNVGDNIYVQIIDVDNDHNKIKLSIKDIDYKNDGKVLKRMAETKSGFEPLRDNLNTWIEIKIKEISDKM